MCKRVAAIALSLLASLALSGCISGGEPAPTSANANSAEAAGRGVDSEARLYLEGRDSVMVAVDEKAFNELINTLSYGGDVVSLIESGKIFTVPNNTRVRILEIATAKNKVRIIDGDRVMQEGWVHEMWIR